MADRSERSFRDALETFFNPKKTNDLRRDFYTIYHKEANEYDTDYIKKYDEDLNTTLIFVRYLSCVYVNNLTWSCRQASSPPLTRFLSSTSIQNFNRIPMINQQPYSAPSFSPSISPQFQMKPLSSKPAQRTIPTKSLLPPVSCMRAS